MPNRAATIQELHNLIKDVNETLQKHQTKLAAELEETPPPTPSTTYPARGTVGANTAAINVQIGNGGATRYDKDIVIKDADFIGGIDFYGQKLVIRNCRFTLEPQAGKWWGGIVLRNPGATLDIADSTIRIKTGTGVKDGNPDAWSFPKGGTLQAQRLDISGVCDGGKFTTGQITDSWIHDLCQSPRIGSNHADGIQIMGGQNIVIARNRIEINQPNDFSASFHNAALFFQPFGATSAIRNVTIENNFIMGGGYALRIESNTKGGPSENFTVRNNVFGPNPTTVTWGKPVHITGTVNGLVWENNQTGTADGTPTGTNINI